jgi:hypothetical protein
MHFKGPISLAQITLEAPSEIEYSSREVLGLTLILGFSALLAVSIMFEAPPVIHKEKDETANETFCQECEEEKSELSNPYDDKLSKKYGQKILKTQFSTQAEENESLLF